MIRRTLLAIAAMVPIVTCSPRASAPPVSDETVVHGAAHRVVLLSLDGLSAVRNEALLARRAYADPEGLSAFTRRGFTVERAIPVDPTLTAASHASIATGAFPARTGIVSNTFHLPGTPIWKSVSGFDEPWGAEALWSAFRRQGKRVGALAFPGCDGNGEARRADFGMTYADAFARSDTERLPASAFAAVSATLPPGVTSDAPLRRATVTVSLKGEGLPPAATFYLTAVDTIADGVTAYDTLLVDADADLSNGLLATVHARDWFPLSFAAPAADGGTRTVGAWCVLLRLPADLEGVVVYRGQFNATAAYPQAFRERLDAAAGFWPGPPDDYSLAAAIAGRDGLGIADYLIQVRRFSDYFTACARVAVQSERFDLLMAYQPIVDEVQHALTITDPRQRDWSEGLAATAAKAVDDTYRIADHAVGELARTLDPSTDALVVVSDHGIAPIWEIAYVNERLHRAGLTDTEARGHGARVAASSRIVAFTAGCMANLYVNLEGREPDGVVAPADEGEVVQAAARSLALWEVDGQPVVEAMFRRDQLAGIGLDSPNSGDLVVFLNEGFAASGRIGGPEHEPATYSGQHGLLNTHADMAAIWYARGAGVRAGHVGKASLTEVAAYVAHLAGVAPPAHARSVSFTLP